MNENVTLQLLASPQSDISDVQGAEQSADHVIRLIAAVFRLCEIEKSAIEANYANMLSPELSTSILWFLHRWSLCYFLPVESNYCVISPMILQAFGEENPGAVWCCNFLLEKINYTINTFKGEPALVSETLLILDAIAENK